MNEGKEHFQIPNREVVETSRKRSGRSEKKADFDYKAHAQQLVNSIATIVAEHDTKKNVKIKSDYTVFKIKIDSDKEIERRGDYENIFQRNNLVVNALIGENQAIVSADVDTLHKLSGKISSYGEKSTNRVVWDYVESFSLIEPTDKISTDVQNDIHKVDADTLFDLEVLIAPVFQNDSSAEKIQTEIKAGIEQLSSEQPDEDAVVLNDKSVLMHIYLPSSAIYEFANENFVLSIDQADYVVESETQKALGVIVKDATLNPSIDLEKLPVVTIIDDGVMLPDPLDLVVKGVYSPGPNKYVDPAAANFAEHGTMVASRLVFGENLLQQNKLHQYDPKVQIIDARVMSKKMSVSELIKRIRKTVEDLHKKSKIFLLPYNTENRFNDENVSKLGAELDALTVEFGVDFIVPTGNQKVYKRKRKHEEIFGEDDTRVSAPADSFLAMSVGSTPKNAEPVASSFSRIGRGFNASMKPGVVYHGGEITIDEDGQLVQDGVEVINKQGKIVTNVGTSFAVPLAAQDTAVA